ncbi:MAG: PKD domain-containing protein [Flavobacteriales bacterium]|nr:PKD domain-containing protein [Flavobacteriales bacterium]
MRKFITSVFLTASIAATAQPGGCDGLHACFVPNALASGNYFFDNCSGAPGNAQFLWDFGDGSAPSTAVHGEHTYLQPGTYEVCLSANWGVCSDSECMTIVVSGGDPCATMDTWFTWEATGNDVQFYAMVVGDGSQTSVHWDFGDGTTSDWAEPQHTYAGSGTYQVCMVLTTTYTVIGGSLTCSREYCAPVHIGEFTCDPDLNVALTWNAASGGVVVFTATSTLPNTNFIWYFGDGTTGTGAVITHVYQQSGPYNMCLAGWYYNEGTQDTCWAEDCRLIIAQGAPCDGVEACFNPHPAQQANAYWFENCSTPEVGMQYVWDFGDGSTSTAMVGEHVFSAPGMYEVCLTVYWQNCARSVCHTVVVPDVICGSLMANFGSIISGNVVQFQNATSGHGPNTMWQWTFGDGSSSNAMDPVHTYAQPGTYLACLTAISIVNAPDGSVVTCQDTYCFEIVAFGGSSCAGLNASFVPFPSGLGVNFSNATTGTGNSASFTWQFGDGSTSNDPQPFHFYAQGGTYEVCLLVVSTYPGPNGQLLTCTDDYCAMVVVGSDPCEGLVACFEPIPFTSGVFVFENCSQDLPIEAPIQYLWDFGDGTSSTQAEPDHVFAPGNHLVCLEVTQGPCTDSTCTVITVGGDPCSGLMACFEALPFGNGAYLFENCSQVLPIDIPWYYSWDFGDGSTSTESDPDHTFAAGTWTVCLVVTHGDCTDEFCTTITVGGNDPCDQLVADFTTEPNGLAIQFIGTTSGPSSQDIFSWSFGDGATGSGPNPVHDYAVQGVYEVCLHVVSILAFPGQPVVTCEDDVCYTVDVGFVDPCAGLVACFQALPFENGAYLFENCSQTLPLGIPVQYFWDFGDGTTSNEVQPDHSFAPGTYEVCLTIVQGNCVDTACTVLTIGGGGPCEQHQANFVTTPSGLAVQFTSTSTGTTANTEYTWSFGDGTMAGGPDPLHDYAQPGVYEVCLTINTVFEAFPGWPVVFCSDPICYLVQVGSGDPCAGLVACFEPIEFNDNAYVFENCSQLLDYDIPPTYLWDFGDGTTSMAAAPEHVFNAGVYNVCLTVTHGTCVHITCQQLVVGGDFCSGLVACFVPLPFENGAYLFENCTQELPIDIPAIYSWDFGDGTTSDEYAPDHAFAPGTYTVCLTVVHGNCTDQTCTTITVIDPNDPCTGLSAGFTRFLSPNGVQFSNTTTGTGFQTTFLWSFGDGTSSTQEQPFHSYQFPGTYEVCLTATSIYQGANGQFITCTDLFCTEITVNGGGNGCDPNYTVNFTWTDQGTVVIFTANANASTVDYNWSFGDGTIGYGQTITHLYEPPGPYEVCVSAWYWNDVEQDTCWTTQCQTVDPFDMGLGELEGAAIRVFPVPASDVLNISGLPTNTLLGLFTADGRLVQSARSTSTTETLDVSGLAKGGYILRVDTDQGTFHRKIVVE